jgi:hypothetical protein
VIVLTIAIAPSLRWNATINGRCGGKTYGHLTPGCLRDKIDPIIFVNSLPPFQENN